MSPSVPTDRDLFRNFERMRREVDELFGEVLRPRRRTGFVPAVDVFYVDAPPRVVLRAELAGIRSEDLALEVRGRDVILAGVRRPEGGSFEQLEIETGPFRRIIALSVEVDPVAARARFDDGMLTVELPLV
jgi:HSP20 family protein